MYIQVNDFPKIPKNAKVGINLSYLSIFDFISFFKMSEKVDVKTCSEELAKRRETTEEKCEEYTRESSYYLCNVFSGRWIPTRETRRRTWQERFILDFDSEGKITNKVSLGVVPGSVKEELIGTDVYWIRTERKR